MESGVVVILDEVLGDPFGIVEVKRGARADGLVVSVDKMFTGHVHWSHEDHGIAV